MMSAIRRTFLNIPAIRLDVWDVKFPRKDWYIKESRCIAHYVQMLINAVNHAIAAA